MEAETGNNTDPRGAIASTLMRAVKPMGLYRIAKESGVPLQSADYWITKMVDECVVVCDETTQQRLFLLQPLFYDPAFARRFDRTFNNLYSLVREKLLLPKDADTKDATFATLLTILHAIDLRQRRR